MSSASELLNQLPYLLDLSEEFKIVIISSEKEEDLLNSEKLISLQEYANQKGIIWDYSKFNYGKYHILIIHTKYYHNFMLIYNI